MFIRILSEDYENSEERKITNLEDLVWLGCDQRP
jgi:hypothetical protein